MKLHKIPRVSSPEAAAPIRLEHYLWSDNGYRPEVQVRMSYSSTGLNTEFRVYESNPLARYTRLNDPVYTDSCVELFLQPAPESDPRYVNFEWNSAGTLYLGLGASRADSKPLTQYAASNFLTHAETDCRETTPEGERVYWRLAFTVGFDFFKELFPAFDAAPGWRMRGNLYKCGEDTPAPHYGCWNLVTSAIPDYHRSEDFGEFVLA